MSALDQVAQHEPWRFASLPDPLQQLYGEVVRAYNSKLLSLAMAGVRMSTTMTWKT